MALRHRGLLGSAFVEQARGIRAGYRAWKDRSDHEMNVRKTVRIQMSSETHTAETMTYKAYIDNIKAKTGKDPEYFQALAKEKGLTKHGELLTWLKSDCGLGHGHANAIILYIQNPELAKRRYSKMQGKKKPRSDG